MQVKPPPRAIPHQNSLARGNGRGCWSDVETFLGGDEIIFARDQELSGDAYRIILENRSTESFPKPTNTRLDRPSG